MLRKCLTSGLLQPFIDEFFSTPAFVESTVFFKITSEKGTFCANRMAVPTSSLWMRLRRRSTSRLTFPSFTVRISVGSRRDSWGQSRSTSIMDRDRTQRVDVLTIDSEVWRIIYDVKCCVYYYFRLGGKKHRVQNMLYMNGALKWCVHELLVQGLRWLCGRFKTAACLHNLEGT